MNGLNDAFERLGEVVPSLECNQHQSKFQTLQMAQNYLGSLRHLITGLQRIKPLRRRLAVCENDVTKFKHVTAFVM